MCGICGTYNLSKDHPIDVDTLKHMAVLLEHRGPDEFGIYRDKHVGLGHTRLSILDLAGGSQPIHNEDKTIWVVYNGEIFNFPDIRAGLEARGHRFYTKTDTEILVHLYEEKGPDFLNTLNGQFAFALWDLKNRRLMLARDRAGVRPLYYTVVDGSLLFASEIKALLADARVVPEMDPHGLDQFFTFWATTPPRTVFKNIHELPPAHFIVAEKGTIKTRRYWQLQPGNQEASGGTSPMKEKQYADRLMELLYDAVKIRLRADVPVASYLSGGLDSSFISSLVKKHFNSGLQTFSVAFTDKDYDESSYQKGMAGFLGTGHNEIACTYGDIGRVMPDVIWHAEKPLIRTASAPMYLLSGLVRGKDIKVVLTGEGADEVLGGYDLFRETKIRRFWARNPASKFRSLLLRRLYPYLPNWNKAPAYLEAFYRSHLAGSESVCYSHTPRWETTKTVKSFFSDSIKGELTSHDALDDFQKTLPSDIVSWDYLSRAQYLEVETLLSGNLLSSQGDRVAMAHSVEGRYPFLDYRVMEYGFSLPADMKLKGLKEKYLLKRVAAPYLPDDVGKRVKQAYRAPDSESFFHAGKLDYVDELLSEDYLKNNGYFNVAAVKNLEKKCRSSNSSLISTKHNMAVTGIITTLLVHKHFIESRARVKAARTKINDARFKTEVVV